jgi:hypothetical protein
VVDDISVGNKQPRQGVVRNTLYRFDRLVYMYSFLRIMVKLKSRAVLVYILLLLINFGAALQLHPGTLTTYSL